MFHFPRLPPPGLCVQPGVMAHDRHRVAPFGNPGISLLDGSPWLIAVIPRPSSARSAKASTVRRSHLTCATPRARICEAGAGSRARCSARGSRSRLALGAVAALRASREPAQSRHVVRTTHVPLAPQRPQQAAVSRESFPQPPFDVVDSALATDSRGDAVDASHHYVPCQGASAVSRPDALRGQSSVGCEVQ